MAGDDVEARSSAFRILFAYIAGANAGAETIAMTAPVATAAPPEKIAMTTPVETAQKIASLFQKETGVRVELFRSGGSAVLRRFLQEIDARRVIADVLTISDPAAAGALIKRDLFVPFRPRNFEKVPAEVKDAKGHHVAQRLNLVGIVAREMPHSPELRMCRDLLDTRLPLTEVDGDPSLLDGLFPDAPPRSGRAARDGI